MTTRYKKYLLLMMGGSGTRFGADVPKQFVEVEGKPTFSYLVEKYAELGFADYTVIVCHRKWVDFTDKWIADLGLEGFDYCVVPGGSSRSESVKNGLTKVAEMATDDDIVFIHDTTHPYVDAAHLGDLSSAAANFGGATMAECQYDTVYGMDPESKELVSVIPRQTVVTGASPEAFKFGLIWPIYKEMDEEHLELYTSAGALALAHDIKMKIVPTDLINLKITYRHDMDAFRELFHNYYF
ncbi:Putative 2-C-methyl-D-erythritol 4-phosphate cytidylyltransferase 2 [Slackia heliotrinireducens]|nr:2-C-methyl-D-erythritol 4-phosphate cytidylyltransferase [Slackia heliotrinireducens]VEH00870.1 Putative 2-C-methyl-D-erythritol 4-phosphate cytidylyltransferase 2 [Slackia heliotrinireducens]